MEQLQIQYLQDIARIKARGQTLKFKVALDKIAAESKFKTGLAIMVVNGTITAQEAHDLARKVLNDNQ